MVGMVGMVCWFPSQVRPTNVCKTLSLRLAVSNLESPRTLGPSSLAKNVMTMIFVKRHGKSGIFEHSDFGWICAPAMPAMFGQASQSHLLLRLSVHWSHLVGLASICLPHVTSVN